MSSAEEDFDQLFGEESGQEFEEQNSSFADSADSADLDEESAAPEEVGSVNIKQISTPNERNYIPYLLKLPGFIGYKSGVFGGESSLKAELGGETEFVDAGDLLRTRSTIRIDAQGRGNARLNRWSDGSWTLQIGSEHFEVLPQAFRSDEHNLLFERHAEESCLEASARLANKLTVRPFTDASGSHRKYLALAEATGRGMKQTKVRVATTTVDPEREKQALVRMQQERIRARRKLDARKRNVEQRAFDRVGREGLSAKFLEAEDGEEGYNSDEEDEYEADFIDDGEIEDDVEGDGDDEEEEVEIEEKKEKSTTRASRLIFDDDDDE